MRRTVNNYRGYCKQKLKNKYGKNFMDDIDMRTAGAGTATKKPKV